MGRVRVRQHVNPLSQRYQIPINLPNWREIYGDLNQPLHLDIGCARGRFLLEMAQLEPYTNFLGVEIRKLLVQEANLYRDQLGLNNLYYLFYNINCYEKKLFKSLPNGVLNYVSIQFPDPWFKQKHIKRRIVQLDLVNSIGEYLVEGGQVLLQSDIESVTQEMEERFLLNPNFKKQHDGMYLDKNPFPVATEREKATLVKGKPIYRVLLKKISNESHT